MAAQNPTLNPKPIFRASGLFLHPWHTWLDKNCNMHRPGKSHSKSDIGLKALDQEDSFSQSVPLAILLAKLLDLFGKVPSLKGPHKNQVLVGGVWIRGVTFLKFPPWQLCWLTFWIYLEKCPL